MTIYFLFTVYTNILLKFCKPLKTLRFDDDMTLFVLYEFLSFDQVRLIQQQIQSKVVQEAILSAEPHRLLQTNSPIVNSEEISLPRAYRTMLSNLYSVIALP